jgi:Protein of unknown function (DUF2656)
LSTETQGRMLLSHNFDLSPDVFLALSREEFFEVFRAGLSAHSHLHCRLIEHPHWMVEILFTAPEFSPQRVGELCAQALLETRTLGAKLSLQTRTDTKPDILILGGLKTTTPTSSSPNALQPGEWGVDVVETSSGDAFLKGIAWEATISQKPADSIFKVVRKIVG